MNINNTNNNVASSSSTTSTKLILHFDINKTAIFGDACQNISFESSLLFNFTECSWGTINHNTNEWELTYNELSFKQPSPELISYSSYLGRKFPNKTQMEIPDRIARARANEQLKYKRRQYSDIFINKGQPGYAFKSKYESILSKLKLPQEYLLNEYNTQKKANPQLHALYGDGFRFLFFSLFNTMIKLTEQQKQFVIIFRTFGDDVDKVVYEFNLFCNGQHPLFNDIYYPRYYFNGTNGSINYVIDNEHKGIMYRFSKDIRHSTLVVGNTRRIHDNASPFNIYECYKESIRNGSVSVINGGDMIYRYIMNMFNEGRSKACIINDDYLIWFSNEKEYAYGKPMFVNPYDTNVVQVFFDDNVTKKWNSIIDCRNVVTEKSMNVNDVWGKYVIRADAISAGIDKDYFVNWILEIEKKMKEREVKEGDVVAKAKNDYEMEKDKDGVDFSVFLGNYIKVMMWNEC